MNNHSIRSFLARILLATTIAYGSLAIAHGEDSELTYMALNGLSSVAISIDGIKRDFSAFGLDEQTVRTATTDRLATHGIKVLDLASAKADPEAGFMKIKLNTNKNEYNFYFYGVSVELKQKHSLNNAAGGYLAGTIWQEGTTGIVMPTELAKMNAIIGKLVEKFLEDYRAENPQQVSSRE